MNRKPKARFHIKKRNGEEEWIVKVPWSENRKPIVIPCGQETHRKLKQRLLNVGTGPLGSCNSASKRTLVVALLGASFHNSRTDPSAVFRLVHFATDIKD